MNDTVNVQLKVIVTFEQQAKNTKNLAPHIANKTEKHLRKILKSQKESQNPFRMLMCHLCTGDT